VVGRVVSCVGHGQLTACCMSCRPLASVGCVLGVPYISLSIYIYISVVVSGVGGV
jgi:hypothetical protein